MKVDVQGKADAYPGKLGLVVGVVLVVVVEVLFEVYLVAVLVFFIFIFIFLAAFALTVLVLPVKLSEAFWLFGKEDAFAAEELAGKL